MGRFSPTVVADSTPRERPGLEIAAAFDEFRQDKFQIEDRETAKEERGRQRKREDISDAAAELQFEQFVRDQLGGTPFEPGDRGGTAPFVPGDRGGTPPFVPGQGGPQGGFQLPTNELGPQGLPTAARDAFAGARAGLAERGPSPLQDRPEIPEEVVILPGQFAGGTFSPQAVSVGGPQTRTLAGREFEIDPTQTLEARTGRAEQQTLQEDIAALIAAGIPEDQAAAVARFNDEKDFLRPREEEKPLEGFDPDDPRSFEGREDFLAFQKQLSTAKDAVGRRPRSATDRGPITLEKAMEEVDRMFGTWNNRTETFDHTLSKAELFGLAEKMAAGELTQRDIDEASSKPPDPGTELPAERTKTPGLRGFFQRLVGGGETGFEDDVEPGSSLETSPDAIPREHNEPPVAGISEADTVADSVRAFAEQIQMVRPDLTEDQVRGLLVEEFDEEEINRAFRRR